ncbi:MAG: hypothetical protein ABFD97_10195 [Syntrophobacter sp.]
MTRKVLLALCLLIVVAPAHASLIQISDYVIYDDVNNQYWERKLTGSDWAYDLQHVASLNSDPNYQSDAWTQWRIATAADMQNLLENSFKNIESTFQHTEDTGTANIFTARYNELQPGTTDSHAWFSLKGQYYYDGHNVDPAYCEKYGWDCTEVYTVLTGYVADDVHWITACDAGGFGTWVVADAVSVPEASTYLLLIAGFAFLLPSLYRTALRPRDL